MFETKEQKEIRARLNNYKVEEARLREEYDKLEKKIAKLPYNQLKKLKPMCDRKYTIKCRLDYLTEQINKNINLLNIIS